MASLRPIGTVSIDRLPHEKLIGPGQPQVRRVTAESEGVDLIIIATHERGVWRHLMFGSGSEKLLLQTPCAVLIWRIASSEKGRNYEAGSVTFITKGDIASHIQVMWPICSTFIAYSCRFPSDVNASYFNAFNFRDLVDHHSDFDR